MKYYTLMALFLVLGLCRAHAQSQQENEPKKLFPNRAAEYQQLKAKEKSNVVDPNKKLDATATRKQLIGPTAPSALKKTPKVTPAAKRVAAVKNPSDLSSADAEKTHAAKVAAQPKNVQPKFEQAGDGPIAAPSKATLTPPAKIIKH